MLPWPCIFGNSRRRHVPVRHSPRPRDSALAALLLGLGCGSKNAGNYGVRHVRPSRDRASCSRKFTRPGKTLSAPPSELPAALPVRVALGPCSAPSPAAPTACSIVGLEGTLPPTPAVDWGVLIVSPAGKAEGVLLYQGDPIQGAPRLGTHQRRRAQPSADRTHRPTWPTSRTHPAPSSLIPSSR